MSHAHAPQTTVRPLLTGQPQTFKAPGDICGRRNTLKRWGGKAANIENSTVGQRVIFGGNVAKLVCLTSSARGFAGSPVDVLHVYSFAFHFCRNSRRTAPVLHLQYDVVL